jgi:hypothetical protein
MAVLVFSFQASELSSGGTISGVLFDVVVGVLLRLSISLSAKCTFSPQLLS